MKTFANAKSRLLVLVLAMAMAVSFLTGGLLFKTVSAEEAADVGALFTVSKGVTVSPASKYTYKSGENEGNTPQDAVTGLQFRSDTNEAFTIELNGIFHRSFGLDWSAPADSWGVFREVVFEISEFGNPDNGFRIHYGGVFQSGTWIEYDYTNEAGETQTLYRSYSRTYNRNSAAGADGNARMLYTDAVKADPITEDIMTTPVLTTTGAGGRTTIQVQKSVDNDVVADVADEGAIINIGVYGSGGYYTFASFRDDPATFVPTDKTYEQYVGQPWGINESTEGYEVGYNLPRLNFENGYTVKIHVPAGVDFMAYNLAEVFAAEGWTSDPWYGFGTSYGTYPVQQFSLTGTAAQNVSNVGDQYAETNAIPEFYKNWKLIPNISVAEYDSFVAANSTVQVPSATYATNGDPASLHPVTDVQYKLNDGEWAPVPAEGIASGQIGNVITVRYSVPFNQMTITKEIDLSVREVPAAALDLTDTVRVGNSNIAVQANAKTSALDGGNVVETQAGLRFSQGIEQSYFFDIVGLFSGNTELRWSACSPNSDWNINGRVEFTIAEAGNPENCFKVVWISPYQSRAYVQYEYGDGDSAQTLYRAQGRNNSGTYYYVLGTGQDHDQDDIADNYDVQYQPFLGKADQIGILGLEWNGDVLNVMANNESGSKQVLASFNESPESFVPSQETKGSTSNLPKISFENGYTVSVTVVNMDFMLYGITTEQDNLSFAAETAAYEPIFYTLGAAMPVFDDLPVLSGVQSGSGAAVEIPSVSYTAGEGAQLSVIWIKPDASEQTVSVGESIVPEEKGDHVLRYTVTVNGVAYSRELTFHVCDYNTFVSGTPSTCTQTGEGLFSCEHGYYLQKEIPVDPSAHSVVYKEEVAATCTATGTKAHWVCLYCGKTFADETCTEELTDLTIEKVPHSYRAEWTWTEENTAILTLSCENCTDQQTPAVNITSETQKSTCTVAGNTTYTAKASFGGEEYTDTKSVALPLEPHTLTKTEAVEATCTAEGNIEYWTCSVCNKVFKDAEGTEEITLAETVVAAKGHTLTKTEAVEATCTTEGNIEFWTCSVCNKVFKDAEGKEEINLSETVIEATGHKIVKVEAKAPTCTEAGNSEYWTCSVCKKVFKDAEGTEEITLAETVVAAKGHNVVKVEAKAPTCTEAGNSVYYKCSECGKCWSDSTAQNSIDEASMKIPAKGHTYEDGVCTVCGAEDPDYVASKGCGSAIAFGSASFAAAGVLAAAVLVIFRKKRLA